MTSELDDHSAAGLVQWLRAKYSRHHEIEDKLAADMLDRLTSAAPADGVGTVTAAMVDRFLSWPLPDSVCADLCASDPGYPHRSGTNLLTAAEARKMLEHVLSALPIGCPPSPSTPLPSSGCA